MIKMMYPMWEECEEGWRSEEERDGVPDFTIDHHGPRRWCLKWRTSAMVSWHESAAAAKTSVAAALKEDG